MRLFSDINFAESISQGEKDSAWTLLQSTFASHWVDGYMAFGYEWDIIGSTEGSEKETKN
jgi:hypothetical protein